MKKNENKTLWIFRNRRITKQIAQLDPVRDHVEIMHLVGAYEFSFDVTRSLELALFRTYASPPISALLDHTREFHSHGQKRYDDTALLISEFLSDGYDGPIGSRAIAQMNQLHGAYKIENESFLFVLSTFIFDPIDWMAKYGWRPFSAGEQIACFEFWRQVAHRMGIRDVPPTIEAFRAWSEAYQAAHFYFVPSNRAVANATMAIVEGWFPRGLKWLEFPTINALIDPALRQAFGYPPPSFFWKKVVHSALKIRQQLLKVFCFESTPKTPRNTYYRSYPKHEYIIEEMGPTQLLKTLRKKEGKDKA